MCSTPLSPSTSTAPRETNSTFSYIGGEMRGECFLRCREVLWALGVASTDSPRRHIVNFPRLFGRAIHMMRRCHFVEDNLTVGNPESEMVVAQMRQNYKQWNRTDATETYVLGAR